MVNHGTPDLCNVVYAYDRVAQKCSIRSGEHLLLDYGVHYWVMQISGLDYDDWQPEDRQVWDKMHRVVSDYRPLLDRSRGLLVAAPAQVMQAVNEHVTALTAPKA
jgi:hypothetical protein